MRDMMQQVSRRQVLMAVMGGILSLFILDIMINNDNKEGYVSSLDATDSVYCIDRIPAWQFIH